MKRGLGSIAPAIMLSLVTGAIGYFAGAMREVPWFLARNQKEADVAGVLTPVTFSELENARALIQAESEQIITEVRAKYGVQRGSESIGAIKDLEAGIEQFKGTAGELILTQELLWFLKKEGNMDRWLEIYLDVLYEHPTDALVGRFASDALLYGTGTRREEELLRGFCSLCTIPIEFPAKHEVEIALSRRNHQNHIARNTPVPVR